MRKIRVTLLFSLLALASSRAFAAPGEHYPQTRTRVLSVAEVAHLSTPQRRYAINEIYARHGLLFGDLAIRKQFLQFDWYKPQPGQTMAQAKARFSRIERQNVDRLGLARELENAATKSDESVDPGSSPYVSPYTGTSKAWKGEHFPETRLDRLTDSDVERMTEAQKNYASNEIYARHGYLFNTMSLRKQFLQFSWYQPRPGRSMKRVASTFSALERANVAVLNAN